MKPLRSETVVRSDVAAWAEGANAWPVAKAREVASRRLRGMDRSRSRDGRMAATITAARMVWRSCGHVAASMVPAAIRWRRMRSSADSPRGEPHVFALLRARRRQHGRPLAPDRTWRAARTAPGGHQVGPAEVAGIPPAQSQ